jgi:hypothetical protein
MKLSEVEKLLRGLTLNRCKDCYYYRQEWHLDWKKDYTGAIQMFMELDNYCWICDIFKKPEGYCDMWEQNVESA